MLVVSNAAKLLMFLGVLGNLTVAILFRFPSSSITLGTWIYFGLHLILFLKALKPSTVGRYLLICSSLLLMVALALAAIYLPGLDDSYLLLILFIIILKALEAVSLIFFYLKKITRSSVPYIG